jgi:hypothetical protein
VPPVTTRTPACATFGAQQAVGDDAGAGERAALAVSELVRRRDLEGDRLGRDHLHGGSTLRAGKHRRVDGLREALLAQDQTRPGATQRFVHGRRHQIGVRHR